MVAVDLKTKECPFCAEAIQEAAIKCRFCGEYLYTKKAKTLIAEAEAGMESADGEDDILFAGRPSLFGMVPAVLKGAIVFAVGCLLVKFPLENYAVKYLGLELTESRILTIGQYRFAVGLALCALVVLILVFLMFRLKMMYYEVNADRIEWSRGILDRRVDNLDMFRVVDLKLRRNIFDCIFGIGTVALDTNDKSDPQFEFEKIRRCRYLYDVIKKASLEADRKTGVVHIE